MSNQSILESLKVKLVEFKDNLGGYMAFSQELHRSVEALEAVPFEEIKIMQSLQLEIEHEAYMETEGFKSSINETINKIQAYIEKLQSKYS